MGSAWLHSCRSDGTCHDSQGWHGGTQHQHALRSCHCHRGGVPTHGCAAPDCPHAQFGALWPAGAEAAGVPDIGSHPAIWISRSFVQTGVQPLWFASSRLPANMTARVGWSALSSTVRVRCAGPACWSWDGLPSPTCMASASVASLSKRHTSHWAPLTNPRSLTSATNSPAQHARHQTALLSF